MPIFTQIKFISKKIVSNAIKESTQTKTFLEDIVLLSFKTT